MQPFLRRQVETDGQASSGLSDNPALATLLDSTDWLNSSPLTPTDLQGRVVLVSFWTYTCINWLRVQPHLRAWSERYGGQGLVVIGVHTPEFDFERDVDNVRRAAKYLRVDYPIALDRDYVVWDAFGNRYWPALYLIDGHGQFRHHRFGEGDYVRSERVIQQLLVESGARGIGQELSQVDAQGVEADADWNSLISNENYLGYARTQRFASTEGVRRDTRYRYGVPTLLQRDHWAIAGEWTMRQQAVVLHEAEGRIAYRFHARDLHLVMTPSAQGEPVRFRITLDGQQPGASHGADADADGHGTVAEPRLYQLLRQTGAVTDRTFEITFLDPGIQVYAFTFG